MIGQGKESNRGGENLTDLEAIFHKDPPIPVMREVARTYIRRATRQAAKGKPLTGTFYWVPVPKGRQPISPDGAHESDQAGFQWTVQEFFDCWTPSSDHAYVWKHVLDSMSCRWKLPIPQLGYGSLPRGRVCKLDQGPANGSRTIYVIYHGRDCPLGPKGLPVVRRHFNLALANQATCDEGQQAVSRQFAKLFQILGGRIGRAGLPRENPL